MKSRIYMIIVLSIVAIISGALLGYFGSYTRPYIIENQKKEIDTAINKVLPGIDKNEELINKNDFKVFKGYKDDNVVGYAVYAKGVGFQDVITLMFGLDKNMDTLFKLEILEQKETPGLGAKITEKDPFLRFWEDRNINQKIELAKPPKSKQELEKNQVNAISGATISSESVIKIVNNGITRVKKEVK